MEIRVATVADALAVETVRLAGWRAGYRGIVPDAVLDALVPDPGRWAARIATPGVTVLLATSDGAGGAAVGMAAVGPCRDDPDEDRAPLPELYALYVDPRAWRTGVGSALLAAAGDVRSLWVLEANARARAFYARHGFRADGRTKTVDLGGPLTELRMLLG